MSTQQPEDATGPSAQDRTPYLGPGATGDDPADDETNLDDLEPAMSPAEEVQLRRDLELELERFEQGLEG